MTVLKHTLPKDASFPLQLRQAKRWLLWAGDKVPYYAHDPGARIRRNGKLDTPRDIARLVDYKAAVAAYNADPGFYSGLGFALGDGWYGIDFDHVRTPLSGLLPAWVATMVEQAVRGGMYAEVSPSGTGLHLIGLWPPGSSFRNGRQSEHVEAYHSGRYFTMTGQRVGGVARLRRLDPLPTLGQVPRPTLRLVAGKAAQPAQIDAGARQPGKVTSGWLADRQTILEALAALSADCDHDTWLRVGLAIHYAAKGGVEGLALWEQWSATAAGKVNDAGEPRYVPGHCASRWASFERTHGTAGAPVTLGTLVHMARDARQQGQQRVPEESAPATPKAPGEMGDGFSMGELGTATLAPTRWLVADLIAPGLTLLAAPPKAGKSYLALQMAMCVAAGKPFLDRTTTQSRVSYFDLEQWASLIKPRMTAIAKGHAIPISAPLHFRLSMGAGDLALDALSEEIAKGSKLIIVDLFARIRAELGENEKKGVYARDYAAIIKLADFALQHPDVAIVVIHHANKGKHDEWQAKISGSYGLTGGSHANIFLMRPELRGMDDADKDNAMQYRVLMAQGKLVEEQELVIEKMVAGGGWQCAQMKAWEVSATLLQTRLLMLLAPKHPAYTSGADIADLLGRPIANVRKLLVRMAQRGTIESEGTGGAGYRVKR